MTRWLLALPVLGFLGFALLYPLARILALGFGEGLGEAFANPYYWGRLAWSLVYGLGSSLLCVLLALPLAYAFRYRFPGRDFLLAFSTVPFVLPTIVVAIGFLSLVGPKGALGINLYGTLWMLFWASVLYNLGLVLRPLVTLLPGLELPIAAARTLGASPVRAYLRVGIPLLLPALLSGGSLVFLYSFTSFGVPLLLGGPKWGTLEVETYTALAYRLAFPEATALVLMQLAVSIPVLLFYLRLQERYSLAVGTYGEPKSLGARASRLLFVLLGMVFLLIYSPLLSLFIRAFERPSAWISVWHSEVFTPAGLALGNTLAFAGLALLLVIPLAGLYAYAVWRGNRLLDWLGLLPLMVSPVAVGLGYLLAYPRLRGSLPILITAYALLSYPLLAR
ncbi:MAG: ABC transporter permease, partial [Meiothermus sp.]